MRTRLFQVITLLVVSVGALLAAELGSRLLVRSRTPPGMIFDDAIIYTYAPHSVVGRVETNALGCVGDDLRRAEGLRVLLLGGSTSFSNAYVDAVRRRLRDELPGRPVAVMSAGKPRYTSAVNRAALERLAPVVRPHVVALYLGINDNIYNTFPWVEEIPRVGYFNWRDPRRSVLLTLLGHYLVDRRLRSVPDFDAFQLRSPGILRDNVERIVATARVRGARTVLSTFAIAMPTEDRDLERRVAASEAEMEHFWGRTRSIRLGVRHHNDVLRGIAGAFDLAVADVAAVMPRDSAHFIDPCHLTVAGNQILGTVVADAVVGALGDGVTRPAAGH